jgi:hypothetical protein
MTQLANKGFYKFLLTDNKGQGLILPLKDAFKKK